MSIFVELKRRNVLRVVAAYLVVGWLLTEVLTTILPNLGAPDWAAKAVILAFAFGFIPTVVLSWVYELTPDGIVKEADLNRDAATGTNAIGKLDYLTIAGVVLAVLYVAIIGAIRSPDDLNTETITVSVESVAVLPFVNMSNDEDNDYFSDGLTETLLHTLTQFPDLKVAARTSSFAFKDKDMDIREIADALDVAHVLEGSVQHADSRVRITAQLIRASDGIHIWSEIYDQESDDIFAIQDEIAMKVGVQLSASLLGTDDNTLVSGVATKNSDAYDIYLQALKQRVTFSYGGLEAAEKLLNGALLIDPEFLDAKIELASNYLHQFETGLMNQEDAFAAAIAMTDEVLLANPNNVPARAIHVYAQSALNVTEGDSEFIANAILELETLVVSDPQDYQARLLLSKMLQSGDRSEEALQLQKESLERDPYNARIHYEIGSLYLDLDQLDDAGAALQASLDIEPLQPNAYLKLGHIALQYGDGVGFFQQYLKAMEVDPRDHEIPGLIAAFLYELRLVEEADDFRKRVIATAPASAIAYKIELLRAISIKDEDASIAAARRAIEDGVEDRQFAFAGAVQYILRRAASNGTVDSESAYLESHWPGILDIDAAAIPFKYLTAQQAAFDAWSRTLPREELLRRGERLMAISASYGIDLLQDPNARVIIMALQGNVEEAIELALSDVFVPSVLVNMDWRTRYSQAPYAELMDDSRIQAAMKAWETEEAEVRDKVRNYLQSLNPDA